MAFGTAWKEYGCPDCCRDQLYSLSTVIDGDSPGYGQYHENDVFAMRRYYWGDCDCGFEEREIAFDDTNPSEEDYMKWLHENSHLDSCALVLPNFLHKRTGLEIRWYKYIGRGMSANKPIDCREFADIIKECIASL